MHVSLILKYMVNYKHIHIMYQSFYITLHPYVDPLIFAHHMNANELPCPQYIT